MERKHREIFSRRTGPPDLDARSDFCFVVRSLRKRQWIGPLLRIADAGLAREVIVIGRKNWQRRGAVGGTACVPYRHIHTPRGAIDYLRSNDMAIVAVGKTERSVSLFDCIYPRKPAFILGDDACPIHEDFLDAADLVVEIPDYGLCRELDAFVAGSVVMYDYLQKRDAREPSRPGSQRIEAENRGGHSGERRSHKPGSGPEFSFVALSFEKAYNMNTVLRCADMGKARQVVSVGRRGWDEKSVISGKSGVPYRHMKQGAITHLKDTGMSIVAVEKTDRSISIFDCAYPPRPAFVLGNEVHGVYQNFLDAADLVVEIPMYGTIRSLNVSHSGAVVMYDYLRKFHGLSHTAEP